MLCLTPSSPREEAGPSMPSRRWAAAGPELRTWRRLRRSWTQAWTLAAAPPAGSLPHPPLPLKPRASTRRPVRRPLRWLKCPRQALGEGAWQPRWASRHPGPKVLLLPSKHQVGPATYIFMVELKCSSTLSVRIGLLGSPQNIIVFNTRYIGWILNCMWEKGWKSSQMCKKASWPWYRHTWHWSISPLIKIV